MTGTVARSWSACLRLSPPRGMIRSTVSFCVASSASSSRPPPATRPMHPDGSPALVAASAAICASASAIASGAAFFTAVSACASTRAARLADAATSVGLEMAVAMALKGSEGRFSVHDEIVAVHRLVGGAREDLAHGLRLQADHAPQLGGGVVADALRERASGRGLAVGARGDLDGVARVELADHLDDADGKQARAPLAHGARGAGVDHERAARRLCVLAPQPEA